MSREQLRAADTDRQVVADQLKSALEEGRLDLSEYDERLRDAYAARTYGDLDRLLTDLPNAAPVVPAAPQARPEAKSDGVTGAWLAHVWGSWARTAALLTLIWAIAFVASADTIYYWPAWVIGPWGAVLLVQTVSGLTRGEPRKYAGEAEHRRRLRAHKQERKELYQQAIAQGELPVNPSKEQRKAFIAEATARGELAPKPRRAGD
ncbi:DUF1707 domain-containing protein [Actinoplanes sp. NPDC026619]|uniref:DUF1707 SHOCT-like domain-containing protein n=1 Tax=Actinoplanes sp. NPDC026619 TaxID=3155798 RepID=UPI003401B591